MAGSSALNQLSIEDIGLTTDHRSVTLAALSDPTRRLILARLRQGEARVGELAEPFALRLPAISRHLMVLERSEPGAKERRAQRRRGRPSPAPLRQLAVRIDEHSRPWEERRQRPDRHFQATAGKEDANV